MVADAVRELTTHLSKQTWALHDRDGNLTSQERVSVNNWLIAHRLDTPVEDWCDIQEALRWLVFWYTEWSDLRKPEPVIVHYDLHPGNIIIADNVVFLDPTLAYGYELQALSFAASRFSTEPERFMAAMGITGDWKPWARREAVCRVNWILRQNYIMGYNAWRGDLKKHLAFLLERGL
jgi:hypothetical protein